MNARKFAEVGLALMSLYVLSNVLSYMPWRMRYGGLRVVSASGELGRLEERPAEEGGFVGFLRKAFHDLTDW